MWQSLCWCWQTLVNKGDMVPAPVVLCKITIQQTVSPSLPLVHHFLFPALSRGPVTQSWAYGVAQKWLQNKLKVLWSERQNTCEMTTCNSITYTGTINQWLEPRLSKEKWDEIQMKKRKTRSQRALYHEKDFNFIFKAMGRYKTVSRREYYTHISISKSIFCKLWRALEENETKRRK